MAINVTFRPLENNKIKVGFIDIFRQENFVFKNFYDPTITIKGDFATWGAKQSNKRIPYYDGIKHADFGTSETVVANIELFGFGNYGDKISRDFGALAIEDPNLLEEFIQLHIKTIRAEMNNDILRKFKQDLNDDGNYRDGAILKNPEALYAMGKDATTQIDNSKLLFDSIMVNGMQMCQRTNLYNRQEKQSSASSLKNFIFLCTYRVYSAIKMDLYASVYHNDQVMLESIFGGVGICDFSFNKIENVNDPTNNKGRGDESLITSLTRMLLIHVDGYKIMDSINPPFYIDTNFMGVSLHTYFFKWLYAFCGVINFMNTCRWVTDAHTGGVDGTIVLPT